MKTVLQQIQGIASQKYGTVGIWLMVCGMPNMGKSTFINQIK